MMFLKIPFLCRSSDRNSIRHSMGEHTVSFYSVYLYAQILKYRIPESNAFKLTICSVSGSDIYCEILDEKPKSGLLKAYLYIFNH